MELNIIDRIYIPHILPSENNFMDYNLKREIIKKVALTEADAEKYKIVEDPEKRQTKWDINIDRENPLVVDFTPQELAFLKTSCEKLGSAPAPDAFWGTVEKIYNAAQVAE